MIAETERRSFYTPPITERDAQPADIADVRRFVQTRSMRRLVESFYEPFTANGTLVVNGESSPPSSFDNEKRSQFDEAIETVAYERTKDLFSSEGKLLSNKVQEWNNVLQIAPTIVGIFLSEDNYIDGISQENAANLVRYGIDVARDPKLLGKTMINVGFGGSDSPFTSTRLEAYALPAVKISRELASFYANREAQAVHKARINKLFDAIKSQQELALERPLEKNERALINDDVSNRDIDELPVLTPEEIAKLYRVYGIATEKPSIRFFFAAQAASGINHTMDPKGIRERTDRNKAVLDSFVTQEFPDVAPTVEIIEDIPWTEHSKATQLMIAYCAATLRQSEDPAIQKTLHRLEKQGDQHGGEHGRGMAAEYAAIHPFIFTEAVNLPFARFFEKNRPPHINITIGGRPEKQFNHIREYLGKTVSGKVFLTFIRTQEGTGEDTIENGALTEISKALERWNQIMEYSRKTYGTEDEVPIPRPDTPFTIRLISDIGDKPTYYLTPFDRPMGANIDHQVQELEGSNEDIEKLVVEMTNKHDQGREHKTPEQIRAELRTVKEAVIFDLRALIKAKKK